MRASSLPKANPPARKSNTSTSDIPSPLHIIKRTKTVEFRPTEKRETSNGSIDYGPDRPLSVMKKRRCCEPVVKSISKIGDPMLKADHISSVEQQQPKPRAALQWLSRHRTSSSSTTVRKHDLRNCSVSSDGSSIGQSSSLELINEEPTSEAFESCHSAQRDSSLSSILTSADYNDDCHLLVPRISITPEVQMSNDAVSTVWAAIEISAQLSLPFTNDMLSLRSGNNLPLSNPLRAGSASRFGLLYNIQVDIIPVPQTVVVDVIQDEKKRKLGLGSSMLILAKVRMDHRQRQSDRAMIQKSNELIADLESELGAASIKYLQVRLRYNHSGFPASNEAISADGTTDWQTQLETTLTGVIAQQALYPTPSSSSAGKRRLFGLVASYWGPIRANEIFSKPSRLANPVYIRSNTALANSRNVMATEDYFTYQSGRERNPFSPLPQIPIGPEGSSPDQGEDPARKIWTEIRSKTLRSRPINHNNNLSSIVTPNIPDRTSVHTGSLKMRSDVDRRREMIRDAALRNKRSIGADSLKSLVPSMMNLDISGKEAWGDSSPSAFNKENVPPERRKEGRWSLGWW
ncbi:hypothetical protein F4678DRAFT_260247 [Xylaria arbuscula]|nr:hypothetical protein F4678DRAFT_260247 [Xylaria arbuscula]